jgi:signal transduction histidine kinase
MGNAVESKISTDAGLGLAGALLDLTTRMLGGVFRSGYRETLNMTCQLLRSGALIPAEACAIFAIDLDSPDELVLQAHSCDLWGAKPEKVRIPLRPRVGGGLTAYIVKSKKSMRLHGSELQHHPYVAGAHVPYLKGPQNSLLAVPVVDQRNRVIALVKLSNKKDAEGISSPGVLFTKADEVVTQTFCNILGLVFESFNVLRSYRRILDVIGSDRGLEDVLGAILQAGQTILGADRGDVAVWEENRGELVLAAAKGESRLQLSQAVPEKGLVYTAWTKQEWQRCADVSTSEQYLEVWPHTRSEIAYPINRFGKRFGVLNFESSLLDNFAARDRQILSDLSHYAAMAITSINSRSETDRVARFFADPSEGEDYALDDLLAKTINDSTLCAILYLANDAKRVLESKAALRVPKSDDFDPKKICYSYEDVSFASKVRRERVPCISAMDPYHDKDVQQTIARKCGIHGPMIGVPLKVKEDVVGVLVVWRHAKHGNRYWETSEEREEIQGRLLALGRLWASLLQGVEATRRKRAVLDEICRISASGAGDLMARLDRIGIALQADGFERVRIFRWDAGRKVFQGWHSLGMRDPEKFLRVTIAPDDNPYTKHTVERALIDPSANLYDPRAKGKGLAINLGLDPNASGMEKRVDIPWAVVPLVFNGKLYGQIAADTAGAHEISREFLEYMTVLGALAAQIIASDEMIERETKVRVEKLGDEVLEVILHTIKTPVHSLVNIVDLLKDNDPIEAPDRSRVWMERLEAQVGWLETLMTETDTFVDCMSRYRVRDESLVHVVSAAAESVTPLASQKRIQIVLETPEGDSCAFAGDGDVIRIIIQNLLDNAVKHTPKGSRVELRVTVDREEKGYRVAVTDEGPGIPDEEIKGLLGDIVGLPRLTNPEGHGLGLAIARTLAARAGGELRYVTRQKARGAMFVLTLPERSRR